MLKLFKKLFGFKKPKFSIGHHVTYYNFHSHCRAPNNNSCFGPVQSNENLLYSFECEECGMIRENIPERKLGNNSIVSSKNIARQLFDDVIDELERL